MLDRRMEASRGDATTVIIRDSVSSRDINRTEL